MPMLTIKSQESCCSCQKGPMEADHQLRCDLYANGSNTGEVRGQLIETVEAMNMAVLPSAWPAQNL